MTICTALSPLKSLIKGVVPNHTPPALLSRIAGALTPNPKIPIPHLHPSYRAPAKNTTHGTSFFATRFIFKPQEVRIHEPGKGHNQEGGMLDKPFKSHLPSSLKHAKSVQGGRAVLEWICGCTTEKGIQLGFLGGLFGGKVGHPPCLIIILPTKH